MGAGDMKLLDLFCGAGGAAMGYHQAGFDEIVGVDLAPQKRYPFTFIEGDALEYLALHGAEFDAIHASPPCQFYSHETPTQHRSNHLDLIGPVRELLLKTGKPWVIENVIGAKNKLHNPLLLCGSMLGLKVWRHRLFETSFSIRAPAFCNHMELPVLVTGTTRRSTEKGGRFDYSVQQKRDAMEVQWMTEKELTQAIPPAYTRWIGERLLKEIKQ